MKRGQFWYNDFIFAFSILAIIGVIFVGTVLDLGTRNKDVEDLYQEAVSLSNSLMSPGEDYTLWGDGNGVIGVVDNSKVSMIKVNEFYAISQSEDGFKTVIKPSLGVVNNFVFYFVDKHGDVVSNQYYGYPGFTGVENLEADNIVIFSRFVFLDEDGNGKGEIVRMVVVTWN